MKSIRLYQITVLALLFNSAMVFAAINMQAPEQVGAGATLSVSWQGLGEERDFITIVPKGEAEGKYKRYQYARKGGPVKLVAPDTPGDYEIRYLSAHSPYQTLARKTLVVTAVTATISAPETVAAGADFSFTWSGPGNDKDFITIVPASAAERKYKRYQYTKKGKSLKLTAPDEPGDYELRYLMGSSLRTLARAPIKVTGTSAEVSGPQQVAAGAEFSVTWEGPNNKQDFITLVERGAPEKSYGRYRYTKTGSPLQLKAPDMPGDYEVRYLTGGSLYTLASYPLQVTATSATLKAPNEVMAGATVEVSWQGPDNRQDFITVVEQGAPQKKYGHYRYTSRGNPSSIRVPETPGDYEFRYLTGDSYLTLAALPVKVVPATAGLQAPSSIEIGNAVPVSWEGPGNDHDYLIIVPQASEQNRKGPYAYVRRGKNLRIASPDKTGEYEIRYVTGELKKTLASVPLTVTPSTVPGTLQVRRQNSADAQSAAIPAIAVILDASGSMLQRMEGRRRIEIAREALLQLTDEVLPENTPFALRVFGHREKDSCRTDLEIPLGPLNRSAVRSKIAAVNAMNLAKTPIADSLQKAVTDLAQAQGERTILLITDGEETCEGDPAAVIKEINATGYRVQVNIVGFAIDELMLRETFQEWARLGGGRYFDAANAQQLHGSLRQSTQVSYEIIDNEDKLIGAGVVGGPPIKLPPGSYRLRVLDATARVYENIEIESDKFKTFNL